MNYPTIPSTGVLLLLCSVPNIFCLCPLKCSCLQRSRNVDCSGKNLTALPQGLQDNITHLNLSHNNLTNLDNQLTLFSNLRSLDLSYNLLRTLPSHLPRSLWEVYAASNAIRILHKLDTAYQWNLKVLDVSRNKLQKIVLINNTLSSLQLLNLSNNELWTVPTNIPYNIQTIDLSNNSLTQILPGTLARMPRLQKLLLHNNRFSYIPNNSFDQLTHLREITLNNNPWSCNEIPKITYLLTWVSETASQVIGYPCATESFQHGVVTLSLEPAEDDVSDRASVFTSTSLPFLEAQETKLYKQLSFIKPDTTIPLPTSDFFDSPDYTLFTDEGSADEDLHIDFNKLITKDASLTNPHQTLDYDYSVTLHDSKAQLNNASVFIFSSTTVSMGIKVSTTKLTEQSSAAHKDKGLATFGLIFLLVFIAI